MPNRNCRHCGKAGLVRTERIIKGPDATTLFFCGGCNLEWEERDAPSSAAPDSQQADDRKPQALVKRRPR
jgi:hypothetical protein